MKQIRFIVYVVLIGLPAIWLFADTGDSDKSNTIILTIDGPIGPATGDYVRRGITDAQEMNAEVVILQMDTPGGLDTTMRDIIQSVIASPVPVAVYVTPSGARAASAGTYILYASHVAAMAPATTLGAATPVRIGGMPETPRSPFPTKPADEEEGDGKKKETKDANDDVPVGDAMEKKMINDAAAYIRGLAQMRGRNADWAEQAVREAASLSSEEALEIGVIDVIANDVQDLLKKIDGRTLNILGQERILATTDLNTIVIEPDWRSRLLSIITDPNILPILMTLGVFGLFYEMLNPGFIFPGVLGAICLLLALYAAQVLPVNYAGMALITLGLLLMVGEAFMPSFGVLGIGGAIAFVIGSIILIDTDFEGYGVSIPFMIALGIINAILIIALIMMAIRARNKPVVSGHEEMIGSIGEVLEVEENSGRIRVHSEDWQVRSVAPLKSGQRVRVKAVEGLTLIVEPINSTGGLTS